MECVSLVVKTRQVGNSVAFFIPADICAALDIGANAEIVAHIHKKKSREALLSLFGVSKGRLGPWTEEDRLDER